ncbi:hypothetical protein J116_022245 [Streptomyces thermolilacinus SPC6]|uniref:Uncharacterized protein n=1 Tax=Streptomyces thermolilacinus SPC6 TaxID=1306406 RepID=A0A1D3DWT7_9ACTN|nr:hypothetical protein J116_022245 [Streptomyces thermolilacinus SPC6]
MVCLRLRDTSSCLALVPEGVEGQEVRKVQELCEVREVEHRMMWPAAGRDPDRRRPVLGDVSPS